MVKTHLPAHMDSVRQVGRPKHQLLIMKCYPRLPKNSAADVKPNGSELSYLLYYASTRRSKLQKVGSFLEHKTAKDVSRWQSARVLVTLQILTALLENKTIGASSGFALIAPHVLTIIRQILQNTNDISLIEATLETWAVFCQHQDQATLKADHQYRELYEDVVWQYTRFAHKEKGKKLGNSTQWVAVHDAIRLREAGLAAIKSVLVSDGLASDSGRQPDVVVPAILSNLRGEDEGYLTHLVRISKKNEEDEKDQALARRMSISTVRTYTGPTDASAEADPRQAEGTAQDADELAEEEAAVLALACLRAVFTNENRGLIRSATSAVLKYLAEVFHRPATRASEKQRPTSTPDLPPNTWAKKLFEICVRWTPVQDRFVLILTANEMMVRLPDGATDLDVHELYIQLVEHIYYSELNLIGISIMDALQAHIQQIYRVLAVNSERENSRSSVPGIFSSQESFDHPASSSSSQPHANTLPSESRIRLTQCLKRCIAGLGNHVYYADQVSDMISAILLRLKPNPAPTGQQNPVATAAAIEEPKAVIEESSSNITRSLRERSNSANSGFFTFAFARQIALEIVRDVMRVSNSARSLSIGGVAESRNKVPISIWEGTQWLLRDPAASVRRAYVDALTTWLQLETNKTDMRAKVPKDKQAKKNKQGVLARRAVSNASQNKDKQSKKATNAFLQLLHLAIYENALQFAAQEGEGEKEILGLHLLLTTLVQRLGVNAIVSGLPMVFALQASLADAETLKAKIRVGSLVHGYLWAVAELFELDVSAPGREIFGEIRKRKDGGFWMSDLGVPARDLEQISTNPSTSGKVNTAVNDSTTGEEAFRSFDLRQQLVNQIADAYASSMASPPSSAPGSPGRSPTSGRRTSVSAASLDRPASSYLSIQKPTASTVLPDKYTEAMMEAWTKEGCLAAIAAAAPKTVSLSGSRSSPSHALATGNHRTLLAAANAAGHSSPRRGSQPKNNPLQPADGAPQLGRQDFGARLQSQSPARRPSGSASGMESSSAGARGRPNVEDLKRVLSGGTFQRGFGASVGDENEGDDVEGGAGLGSEDGGVTMNNRKGLADLLAGLGTDVKPGAERRQFVGMGKPPY